MVLLSEVIMPSEYIRSQSRMTASEFQAFDHSRPEPEKWELIDGVAIKAPLPSLVHQRISRNIGGSSHEVFESHQPEWSADHEFGVQIANNDKYNPVPDIRVIDTVVRIGQVYAERFYFVV